MYPVYLGHGGLPFRRAALQAHRMSSSCCARPCRDGRGVATRCSRRQRILSLGTAKAYRERTTYVTALEKASMGDRSCHAHATASPPRPRQALSASILGTCRRHSVFQRSPGDSQCRRRRLGGRGRPAPAERPLALAWSTRARIWVERPFILTTSGQVAISCTEWPDSS